MINTKENKQRALKYKTALAITMPVQFSFDETYNRLSSLSQIMDMQGEITQWRALAV